MSMHSRSQSSNHSSGNSSSSSRSWKPVEVESMEKVLEDESYTSRCQRIVNGIQKALAMGEIVCLFTGDTFSSLTDYNKFVYSRKVRNINVCNLHISSKPPGKQEMKETLEVCKAFLEKMRPVNSYIELYMYMLKADYEYEMKTLLDRLQRNDEADRLRLESDGYSYFGMKLFGSQKGAGELFIKADGSALPYSFTNISPGQTVWVSPEDAPSVQPGNNMVTCVGEVGVVNRESILIKGLSGLPYGKSGLYRIDLAVTTVNLERMQHAMRLIRRQHELHWMEEKRFHDHIPGVDFDEEVEPAVGLMEADSPLARFFFHNIRYSLANARQYYRMRFGVSLPPGLPNHWDGFSSYDLPPKPTDGPALTPDELNEAALQRHPQLKYLAEPLDDTKRPLDRSQHWLNDKQLAAVAKVLDDRPQMVLIQGPPGTGKTTTAIAIICEWVKWYGHKILATAHSNKGVDNLLQGLVNKGIKVLRVGRGGPTDGSDLGEYTLETLVDQHPHNRRRDDLQSQLKSAQRNGAPQNVIQELMDDIRKYSKPMISRTVVKDAEVICATCVGVGSPIMQALHFDLVLVDEATQAVEPSVMIPITRGAKQVVMIGDQAQLPPTCKCPDALMMGLDISLFDRLIGNGLECHVLTTQYRMHPTISCFPSWRFYYSGLTDGITAMDRILPSGVFPTPESRVCFLDVNGQEEQANTSKLNRVEADCVVWVVQQLMRLGNVKLNQVGIITPYAAQVRILKQSVQASFGNDAVMSLEVHSVDGFQGREKDFIILSMVRSKAGGDMSFIADWRRTNVSLTRAKYGVIVVGQAEALLQSPIWLDWLKFYRKSLLGWDSTSRRLVQIQPRLLRRIMSRPTRQEDCTMEEMLIAKLKTPAGKEVQIPRNVKRDDSAPVPCQPASTWAVANSSPAPQQPSPANKDSSKRDIEYVDIEDSSDDEKGPPAKKANKGADDAIVL